MAASGIPFNGPIGAAQVGYKDGEYLLNPDVSEMEGSDLDLMVAGTKDAVLMVESEAKELSEEVMLGAVMFGHEHMQVAIDAISEFAKEVGNERWEWSAAEKDEVLSKQVADICEADLKDAFQTADKMERQDKVAAAKTKLMEALVTEDENSADAGDVSGAFKDLEKKIVRSRIIAGEPRIDGRDNQTVRAIESRVGVLPRTHGSALFTRG